MKSLLSAPIAQAKPKTNRPLMKTNRTHRLTACCLVLILLAAVQSGYGQSQIPAAINYQGQLRDTLGDPVSSGYYEIEFRIWDDAVQSGAGNLVWGRSFALHVVTNGLFNILLNDDGGLITSPSTPSNTLLEAFGGEDRYLGLTITQSNGVSIAETEISPRQRLASAPYAIQAQTANLVASGGVSTASLASGSVTAQKMAVSAVSTAALADGAVTTAKLASGVVTTDKLANNAVTAAKLASAAVTAAKIEDGAVTSAKLNIDDDFDLNDHDILLQTSTADHGLGWYGGGKSFGSVTTPDGPILYGWAGGMLATLRPDSGSNPQPKAAMSWDHTTGVSLFGAMVDLSSHVTSVATTPTFTAHTDGLMMYYGRRGQADLQVWINGGTTALFSETSSIKGATFFFSSDGNDGRSVMWPIKKGDKFRWNIRALDTNSSHNPINNKLFFLPLGQSQGSSSVSPN